MHPRFAQLSDGRANLLQRDAGVEQALDEFQHEDVAKPIQALRARTTRALHGRLNEARARPVVELAVANPRGFCGHGALESAFSIELR